jgi:uncharacterized glyoxalase superfamily metalloenzyme YdcJ
MEEKINVTINELLGQIKIVRERLNELKTLRNQSATKTRSYFQETKTETEQLYDVRLVDKQVIKLEKFLFLADALVKQSNAMTQAAMPVSWSVDELLAPIE